MNSTLVHVLGCHLQAKRSSSGESWDDIVWKGGSLEGRVAQGLRVACNVPGPELSFGTGASKDAHGISEARRMCSAALDNTSDLEWAGLTKSLRNRLGALVSISRLDEVSQNTAEEINLAMQHAMSGTHSHVVFVTSGFHVARVSNEVAKWQHEHQGALINQGVMVSVISAFDSPGSTIVVEEPHRGDMESIDFPGTLKRIFKFLRNPILAERLRKAIDEVITGFEQLL